MEAALVLAPLVAALGALVYGWFCVRLSGVSLTMLTLAFAQITWAVCYQWDSLTGGSNGITGVWPSDWWAQGARFYWLTLTLVALGVLLLRRVLLAPLGYALRAGRDAPLRAEAIGIDVRRVQWIGFVLAGALAGLAGALFLLAKGSISPEALAVAKSVDGLVMVLLGGVQTLAGPLLGAGALDLAARHRGAQHRLLARLAGRHHAAAGAGLPAGAGRFCAGLVGPPQGGCMSAPLLQVTGLSRAFGGVQAVRWRGLFAG